MVGSVALLSDVHGVLPVLDAVLAEPDVQAADRIVITGDHVAGPMPAQVLDRFAELGEKLILVRGNADREIVALAENPSLPTPDPIAPWAAQQLNQTQLALLAGLPHPVYLDLDGFGSAVFCHGTPRDDDEVVLVDTRLERWYEVFDSLDDRIRVIGCGHTHMPFVRLVDRRLVVNPGSIGMPYGRPGGNWALLRDGQVSLRHTPLDPDAICAAVIAGSDYPEVEQWADDYLRGRISDASALTTFGPRDGR